MKLSIIGLGKLGSPMVAVFAKKGFEVIGLDLNAEFVQKLNQGIAPVNEPQLQELISECKENIEATQDYEYAVLNTEITFIIVPTPSDENGIFTNKFVLNAVEKIAGILKNKQSRHIVVITSTVMPGSTDGEIKQKLESISGKTVGRDVGLCYNPEFIALGSVVHDMLHPDFILIGESDKESGDILESIYKSTCGAETKFRRMNCVNAELTKISINTYVTTKISYANMISELCDKIPGADAAIVCNAIGTDSRVGNKYLGIGLGYGGPCFPRDNIAFAALATKLGSHPLIAKATDSINDLQPKRVVKAIDGFNVSKIAILGLSYKAGSEVVEESQAIMIANELAMNSEYTITAFDPQANNNAKKVLDSRITLSNSIEGAVENAELLIIATPWPEFTEFFLNNKSELENVIVVDCWRILDKSFHNKIFCLGSNCHL